MESGAQLLSAGRVYLRGSHLHPSQPRPERTDGFPVCKIISPLIFRGLNRRAGVRTDERKLETIAWRIARKDALCCPGNTPDLLSGIDPELPEQTFSLWYLSAGRRGQNPGKEQDRKFTDCDRKIHAQFFERGRRTGGTGYHRGDNLGKVQRFRRIESKSGFLYHPSRYECRLFGSGNRVVDRRGNSADEGSLHITTAEMHLHGHENEKLFHTPFVRIVGG
jgi:hypothetical protein